MKLGLDSSELDREMKKAVDNVKSQMKIAGAAMAAVGIAGLAIVSSTLKLNAQLGATGITLGKTSKEMRDLALSTTDASFPLKSVADTFDLLSRAGIRDAEQLRSSALAFDALADATNSSAEILADLLLPAFKLFGKEIPTTTAELDKFTWLTKNTLVDLSDFGTLLTRMAPYMDELNLSMDDAIVLLAALSEHGITGTAATLALRTAITQAASSGESLTGILGITNAEIVKYRDRMNGAVGITDDYRKKLNESITIMDKVKQKWSELTLSASGFLEPLEPIMAGMTALGPLMIAIALGIIPKFIVAVVGLGQALMTLLLNPITLIVAGLGMMAFGIYKLIKLHADWNKGIEAAKAYNEALAASQGLLTDEVIEAAKAYIELREAMGQLTPQEAGQIATLKMLVKNHEDMQAALSKTGDEEKKLAETVKEATARLKEQQELIRALGWEAGIPEEAMVARYGPAWAMTEAESMATLGMGRVEAMRQYEAGLTPQQLIGPAEVLGYQHGGIIREPTLLTRISDMKPYAVAGEAGAERVSPLNQTASVLITGNTFNVRDEKDIDKIGQDIVGRIRLKMGVKI